MTNLTDKELMIMGLNQVKNRLELEVSQKLMEYLDQETGLNINDLALFLVSKGQDITLINARINEIRPVFCPDDIPF